MINQPCLSLLTLTLTLIAGTALAEDYLPKECTALPPPPPAYYCPTPYVELVADEYDEVFERNFLCQETSLSLGLIRDNIIIGGCGSSYTRGWSLPPSAPTALAMQVADGLDYRAEIIANVIDPCYLTLLRNKGGIKGMEDATAVEMLKVMQMDSVNELVSAVLPVVVGKDLEFRTSYYKIGVMQCIKGGTES